MAEPSNRNGRAFMRLDPNDEVLGVEVSAGDENVCLASRESYVLIFPVGQVNIVKGAAKGVRAIRLGRSDALIGRSAERRAGSEGRAAASQRSSERSSSTAPEH